MKEEREKLLLLIKQFFSCTECKQRDQSHKSNSSFKPVSGLRHIVPYVALVKLKESKRLTKYYLALQKCGITCAKKVKTVYKNEQKYEIKSAKVYIRKYKSGQNL